MKTLIILVGIPGSGKSTLAKKMQTDCPEYVIINQDAFNGNRQQTWSTYQMYMDNGQNVILDRCNSTRDQRRVWINYAKQLDYTVECVHLCTDPLVSIDRIMKRKGHKTIKETTPIDKVREIVLSFNKSFQEPTMSEGYDYITAWRNDDG